MSIIRQIKLQEYKLGKYHFPPFTKHWHSPTFSVTGLKMSKLGSQFITRLSFTAPNGNIFKIWWFPPQMSLHEMLMSIWPIYQCMQILSELVQQRYKGTAFVLEMSKITMLVKCMKNLYITKNKLKGLQNFTR